MHRLHAGDRPTEIDCRHSNQLCFDNLTPVTESTRLLKVIYKEAALSHMVADLLIAAEVVLREHPPVRCLAPNEIFGECN